MGLILCSLSPIMLSKNNVGLTLESWHGTRKHGVYGEGAYVCVGSMFVSACVAMCACVCVRA